MTGPKLKMKTTIAEIKQHITWKGQTGGRGGKQEVDGKTRLSSHCILRLDKTVLKFSVADSLVLSVLVV